MTRPTKAEYTWPAFLRWGKRRFPKEEIPENGCMLELLQIFKRNPQLKAALIENIRVAPGDRASAIYCARRDGWWPPESAVEDIRVAPGDRALAIYYARRDGWWPKKSAVADIRKASGNRAWAIYYARSDDWWPKKSAVEDIRVAPGDRAWAIYCARRDGWWPLATEKPPRQRRAAR